MSVMSVDTISRLFTSSPIGKEILSAHRKETDAGRKKHMDAIAAIEKELAGAIPKLDVALSKANEKLAAAREALERAKVDANRAFGERHSFQHTLEHRIQQHRQALDLSCDRETIDAFRAEIETEQDAMRARGVTWLTGEVSRVFGLSPVATSNTRAFNARTRRLADIMSTEIPELAYIPTAELPDVIDALRESVPSEQEFDDPSLARRLLGRESEVVA